MRYTGDTPVARPFTCDTSSRQAAGCPLIIHFLEVLVYSYEELLLHFFNKHSHKVTQVSSGCHWQQWQKTKFNPPSNFQFHCGQFCASKELQLKCHSEMEINIFNYLHKFLIKTVPPVSIRSWKPCCSSHILTRHCFHRDVLRCNIMLAAMTSKIWSTWHVHTVVSMFYPEVSVLLMLT